MCWATLGEPSKIVLIPEPATLLLCGLGKVFIKPKNTDKVFLTFNKSINAAELIRNDLTVAKIPLPESEQKAINLLPNFGNFVLSTILDTDRIKHEIVVDTNRHKKSQETFNNAFLAINQTPRVGLEPTTWRLTAARSTD